MKRWVRPILHSLLVLAIVLAVVAGGGFLWVRGSLPRLDGTLVLEALEQPVEVLRDRRGIVTIRAESERDAMVALGFAHAQDRLWQMDFNRRMGAGRLSEVVGPATLRLDRFARTLGLYRTAEASASLLSEPVRDALDAYASGVNAFLEQREGPPPPEFLLLRYEPEPWKPADSLVWGRLMALQLSGNWPDELKRARLVERLPEDMVDTLWPAAPQGTPTSIMEAPASGAPEGEQERTGLLPDFPWADIPWADIPWEWAPKDASNGWVVAGKRSATGAPVLANDPHLGLTAPGMWYLVRIETPELILTGATAPGVPFLVLGHNGHVAWGLTTTHGDVQDIFIEQAVGLEGSGYMTPDGPESFETREETIEVDGEEPITFTVRSTRHGPVIDDILQDDVPTGGPDRVLALAWPALDMDDRTPESIYLLNRARNARDVMRTLELFHSPQQNVVFADREGAIGFAVAGRTPIRSMGDGSLPVPGWTGDYDWQGYIPFEDLPRALNLERGWIANANNKVVPESYPYPLAAHWPEGFRAERIGARLREQPRHAVEDSQRLQLDTLSLAAKEILLRLLALVPPDEDIGPAVEMLRQWDYRMDRERPEPLIYKAWLVEFAKSLLADELMGDFLDFQRPQAGTLLAILDKDPRWCDDVRTKEEEGCAERARLSLKSALEALRIAYGETPSEWRWGEAHRAWFRHPVYSRIPVVGELFADGIETGGDDYTVNRGGSRATGEARFDNVHGPGYRAVYDLSDLGNSRFMIATGQSGNPLSPYYGNMTRAWRDGRYVKLVGEGEDPAHRLLLNPGQ